jgi:hypothetical protein
MAGIPEEELLQFLKAIEDGMVFLQPEEPQFIPQYIYAGNISYKASNGWRITIFNDCNEWDYVDEVMAADGRALSFDDIENDMPAAREYTPSDEIAWSRYGIPGYMRFRCIHCGVDLKEPEPQNRDFLCIACRQQQPGGQT